jgi:hypothetical protein
MSLKRFLLFTGLSVVGLLFLSGSARVGSDRSDIISTSNELTQRWLDQMGDNGWLYLSYKDEFLVDESGVDPETGRPLARRALWELWYELDSSGGEVISVLVRHTDLDSQDVTRVAWKDDTLLRYPSGTMERGHPWEYQPIRDHFCNTEIGRTMRLAGDTSGTVTDEWVRDKTGDEVWEVRMTVGYPAVSTTDVSGQPNQYVATETRCTRQVETGAIQSSELAFVTEDGKRILYERTYDYSANRVQEPPAEMRELLEQLIDRMQ